MAVQFSERSYIDSLSSVRKVVIPCDDNSSNMNMRQIHASQIGYICPCETPEGKTVGLIKYLSMHCLISKYNPEETDEIINLLTNTLNQNVPTKVHTWVILDGAIKGWCNKNQANNIKTIIKEQFQTVSCSFDKNYNMMQIRTTGGRPIRPLLVIKNHPFDWSDINTWSNMIKRKQITYLDSVECSNSNIVTLDYNGSWKNASYMEIHPCTMLGLAASLIPFPEHNQSARNVFSSSMIKQSLQMQTYDKTCTMLQKPLVSTIIGKMLIDDKPNGVNLVTCIMSITGFNQEDAIIVKKSCVDRGLFSSVVKKTICIIVDNPWKITYDNACVNVLSSGVETKLTEAKSMYSKPTILSIKQKRYNNVQTMLTITFLEHRTLELGDKLSSRHGQKGVVGLLMNEEDMPFTKEGITPDIIINPHAIPSRMTVGQLLESVLGKDSCKSGCLVDGTPFLRENMHNIETLLSKTETQMLTLGTTGQMIETPIAIGLVYYMALAHQVADKIYVRSDGVKSMMSRQPISGRSKGGGLRFGYMEYDCLIAHGASNLITEVSNNSDSKSVPYCQTCCIITDTNICKLCNNETVENKMPFSYVVLKDLMLASGIKLQTKFDNR